MTADRIGVSDMQTIAAARVTPTDGDSKPFIVMSMYAAWRQPHPSTGREKDAHVWKWQLKKGPPWPREKGPPSLRQHIRFWALPV